MTTGWARWIEGDAPPIFHRTQQLGLSGFIARRHRVCHRRRWSRRRSNSVGLTSVREASLFLSCFVLREKCLAGALGPTLRASRLASQPDVSLVRSSRRHTSREVIDGRSFASRRGCAIWVHLSYFLIHHSPQRSRVACFRPSDSMPAHRLRATGASYTRSHTSCRARRTLRECRPARSRRRPRDARRDRGDSVNRSDEPHECSYCGDRVAYKPVAREDSLDEPIGHLCLLCYSGWVQLSEIDPDCVVCGEASEYYTVRRLADLGGNEVLTTGNIGVCRDVIHKYQKRQWRVACRVSGTEAFRTDC